MLDLAIGQETASSFHNFRKLIHPPFLPPRSFPNDALDRSRFLSIRLCRSRRPARHPKTTAFLQSVPARGSFLKPRTDLKCRAVSFDFLPRLRAWNEFPDPTGHVLAAGFFGAVGYFEYLWEQRADELIALKREEIAQNRKNRIGAPSGP